MTDSPTGGLSTNWATGPGARTRPPTPAQKGALDNFFLRLEQRAPRGVDVQDLRPLRGRPCGPILDLDAYPGALTSRRRTAREKITYSNTGLTDPAPSGMTCGSFDVE
jgi:hypothetical protein